MYQDENFEVREAVGLIVQQLVGFTDAQGDDEPEKLLLYSEQGQCFAFYLSAFSGHWDVVDDESHENLLAAYESSRRVDYSELYGLIGARVQSVKCARDQLGTHLLIRLDRGDLTLEEVNQHDPHSDSRLSFAVRRPHVSR